MKRIVFSLLVLGFIYAFSATEAKAQAQCKNLGGVTTDKICPTKAEYDACLNLMKQGTTVNLCVMTGDQTSWVRRATFREAIASLTEKKCTKTGTTSWMCPENVVFNYCNGYKNFFALMDMKNSRVTACQAAPPEKKAEKPVDKPAEKADSGDLYVYAVGLDDRLWTIKKTKGVWGGRQQLAPVVGGGVDACSPNPGKIIVAFRAQNNAAYIGLFDYANGKHGWFNFISKIGSDPTVLCQSGDRVTYFVRGHNNTGLYGTYAENGVWALMNIGDGDGLAIEDVVSKGGQASSISFWDKITFAGEKFTDGTLMITGHPFQGAMKGSPDGVAFGGDNRAVFVRGTDDRVWWRMTSDNKTWSNWQEVSPSSGAGIKITSDPSAVSRKNGEILLFARGENNMLWVTQYKGGAWTGWVPWGGVMAGSPDATSWGDNRVDVFYRNADGSITHVWRDDTDGLIKEPKSETVPNMAIKNDLTAVGVKW